MTVQGVHTELKVYDYNTHDLLDIVYNPAVHPIAGNHHILEVNGRDREMYICKVSTKYGVPNTILCFVRH